MKFPHRQMPFSYTHITHALYTISRLRLSALQKKEKLYYVDECQLMNVDRMTASEINICNPHSNH